ncbi:hypothetical protein LMB33_05605 [Limosilactobacillus reuteri]|uniref:hypothetical protein n=1 Tax=Limosilactobacillus reuteri TaxID=1598 RepID=UPI001E2E4208|nr:hypothetical protein [Limosilactobacillus reuteri]MCC4326098.1 hypothetical protein [Limosilactobacillus reuteri]MCC4329848.1 hypothetical protein [Limosilactobacillus reuteri]
MEDAEFHVGSVKITSVGNVTIHMYRDQPYHESLTGRLYQMNLDWDDLLDTDPKDYQVTDEQINLLFS